MLNAFIYSANNSPFNHQSHYQTISHHSLHARVHLRLYDILSFVLQLTQHPLNYLQQFVVVFVPELVPVRPLVVYLPLDLSRSDAHEDLGENLPVCVAVQQLKLAVLHLGVFQLAEVGHFVADEKTRVAFDLLQVCLLNPVGRYAAVVTHYFVGLFEGRQCLCEITVELCHYGFLGQRYLRWEEEVLRDDVVH